MPDEKTINRIKSILRKAGEGNPSEEERAVAMQMAQRLMLKHGIDESELGDLNTDGRDFGEEEFFSTQSEAEAWKGVLLCNIAPCYFCDAYAMNPRWAADRHTAKWYLMGRADHVEVCKAMFNFIVPQIEAKFAEALVNFGNIQERHARTYALETCREMQMGPDVVAGMEDEDLAAMGALRLEAVALTGDPVEDIMQLCEIGSYNYAKKVRAYVLRKQIGNATPGSRLDSWRKSFFMGALAAVADRLRAMTAEEVSDLGDAGTSLVLNEREALQRHQESIGHETHTREERMQVDPHGARAGVVAGEETDLSRDNKITTPRRELEA